MNLREFTEEVDRKSAGLTKNELQIIIHSLARKVPESMRNDFVMLLDQAGESSAAGGEGDLKLAVRNLDEQEIQKEFIRLKELFGRIGNEELCFRAEGYEDYSSGYWEADYIWEYEDPDGIGRIYEETALFIQRCVNDGFYREAVELFDRMAGTEAMADDGGDFFGLGLEEMVNERLVVIDSRTLALHVLYAAYRNADAAGRPEALFEYFKMPFFRNIRLESMLSLGREELEGLPEFWDGWIALLMRENGDVAGRLLKEAVLYQKEEPEMLAVARQAKERHPSLYLALLERYEKKHDYSRQIEIGREALEAIDPQYTIRSQAALMTAEACLAKGQDSLAEQCWLEAFASATKPVHYLRIMAESRRPEDYREETMGMISRAEKNSASGRDGAKELDLNALAGDAKPVFQFLTGDFDAAMEQCRKMKQPLGWTGKFIKCGVALFLLLLYKGDKLEPGCSVSVEDALFYLGFKKEEYFRGTRYWLEYEGRQLEAPEEKEVFWQCFLRWKAGYSLTSEQEKEYLSYLETVIDQRVRAIVSGQHRNYYSSVAALAAALGEVKASMGDASAKDRIMWKYKEEFPRHSSLHAALREYGMTDLRKKGSRF